MHDVIHSFIYKIHIPSPRENAKKKKRANIFGGGPVPGDPTAAGPLGGRARLRGAEPFRRARHLASRNPNLFSFFGKIWQTQCHFLARFGNSIVTFWQGLANTLKDSFLSLRNQLHNTTNHTGASRRTRRCCVEPQVQEPHSPTWTAVPAGSRSRRSILLTAFVSKSATFDRFY